MKKKLEVLEVKVIKFLLNHNKSNQEILGIINERRNVPNQINSGRISEIKKGIKYPNVPIATKLEYDAFVKSNEDIFFTKKIEDLLKVRDFTLRTLDIYENDEIECKENFSNNFNSLIKPMAAFANNKGGFIFYGIIDKTYEVKGLSKDKLKDFDEFDLKNISELMITNFGEELKIRKLTYNILGKNIGIIYIYPSEKKPIIIAKNDSKENISTGQIYYRYPAESRLIGKIELEKIIEERISKTIAITLSKHIETIIRNGIENTAILNVKTGEVTGKSGSFFIDENILPQINFIKEGEFVEKKGSPTLKLIGEVEPFNSITTIEHQTNISIKKIIEIFCKQEDVKDPVEYIKQIGLENGKWMPIHFLIKKSHKEINEIIKLMEHLISSEGKNYPNQTIEMLKSTELPPVGNKKQKTKKQEIINLTSFNFENIEIAKQFLSSLRDVSKEQIDLKYCLDNISKIVDRYWNNSIIKQMIKYDCVYLDNLFYKNY